MAETSPGTIAPVMIVPLLAQLPLHPYQSPAWEESAPFTVADVHACTDPDPGPFDAWNESIRALHIARIAHFVRCWHNDGSDAPQLYLGGGISLIDGWHRLAAAMARNEDLLHVELLGDMDDPALAELLSTDTGSSPSQPSGGAS